MDFTINGRPLSLAPRDVTDRLNGVAPEPVVVHGVVVSGVVYPPKQAFSAATGLARDTFTTQTARRHLERLGFECITSGSRTIVGGRLTGTDVTAQGPQPPDPHAWPWEGAVQRAFTTWLKSHGWIVTSEADTATRAHGVDVLARRGERKLGAEVKGWPAKGYADARRSGEVKRTQPTTQAGHWFSQALMKAIMLLDSHPDHESLMVLPDYPRYRDLALRTSQGRAAAGVHVVFVRSAQDASCDTWGA